MENKTIEQSRSELTVAVDSSRYALKNILEDEIESIYEPDGMPDEEDIPEYDEDTDGSFFRVRFTNGKMKDVLVSKFIGNLKEVIELKNMMSRVFRNRQQIQAFLVKIRAALQSWTPKAWKFYFQLAHYIQALRAAPTELIKEQLVINYLLLLQAGSIDKGDRFSPGFVLDIEDYDRPLDVLDEKQYSISEWTTLKQLQDPHMTNGSIFEKRPDIPCGFFVAYKQENKYDILEMFVQKGYVKLTRPIRDFWLDDRDMNVIMERWSVNTITTIIKYGEENEEWMTPSIYLTSKTRSDALLVTKLMEATLVNKLSRLKQTNVNEFRATVLNVSRTNDPKHQEGVIDALIQEDMRDKQTHIWDIVLDSFSSDPSFSYRNIPIVHLFLYVDRFHRTTYIPHIQSVLGKKWNAFTTTDQFMCVQFCDPLGKLYGSFKETKEEKMTSAFGTRLIESDSIWECFERSEDESRSLITLIAPVKWSRNELDDLLRRMNVRLPGILIRKLLELWKRSCGGGSLNEKVRERYMTWRSSDSVTDGNRVMLDDPMVCYHLANVPDSLDLLLSLMGSISDVDLSLFDTAMGLSIWKARTFMKDKSQPYWTTRAIIKLSDAFRTFKKEQDADQKKEEEKTVRRSPFMERLNILQKWVKEKRAPIDVVYLEKEWIGKSNGKGDVQFQYAVIDLFGLNRTSIESIPVVLQVQPDEAMAFLFQEWKEQQRKEKKSSYIFDLIVTCMMTLVMQNQKDLLIRMMDLFPEVVQEERVLMKWEMSVYPERIAWIRDFFLRHPQSKPAESVLRDMLRGILRMYGFTEEKESPVRLLRGVTKWIPLSLRQEFFRPMMEKAVLACDTQWLEWLIEDHTLSTSSSSSSLSFATDPNRSVILDITRELLQMNERDCPKRNDLLRALWVSNLQIATDLLSNTNRALLDDLKAVENGRIWMDLCWKWNNRSLSERRRYQNVLLDQEAGACLNSYQVASDTLGDAVGEDVSRFILSF